MLQNKSVLIFLWLSIFVFIGFLFFKNNDSREIEAVLKSTELLRSYDKELFDKTDYEIEKKISDKGNDIRDRKILDRFKKNRVFLDSLDKMETLDWSILFGQLVQSYSPRDSIDSYNLIDSSLYSYSKIDSKPIFTIHQNLLYHYCRLSLYNERLRVHNDHRGWFGGELDINILDFTIVLYTYLPIYNNFIIEPHFDKPKYYSANFIFNKDSVIRFQAITKIFMNGEKIKRTKRYEITPTNGKILSPLSYKEIKK